MTKGLAPTVENLLTAGATILHKYGRVGFGGVKVRWQDTPSVQLVATFGLEGKELLVRQVHLLPLSFHFGVILYDTLEGEFIAFDFV